MKNTPRIAAIQPSVMAAFLALGDLNALTPLEMASVPVIATHPSANPRRMRNTSAKPAMPCDPCAAAETTSMRGAPSTGASSWPSAMR